MALHVQTIRTVTDDLTGAKGAQTVRFGLNGKNYRVDLTPGNQRQLEKALGRYIRVAQEEASRDRTVGLSQIRAWAKENGFTLGDRGRISGEIQNAYFAAHPVEVDEDEDGVDEVTL